MEELSLKSKISISIIERLEIMSENEILDKNDDETLFKLYSDLFSLIKEIERKEKILKEEEILENEYYNNVKNFKNTSMKYLSALGIVASIIVFFVSEFSIRNLKSSTINKNKEIINESILKQIMGIYEVKENYIQQIGDSLSNISLELDKKKINLEKEKEAKQAKEELNKIILELNKENLKSEKEKEKIAQQIKDSFTKSILELEREDLKTQKEKKGIDKYIVILSLIMVLLLYILKDDLKNKEKIVDKLNIKGLTDKLEEDFINNLIKINIHQLTSYNNQTKSQANKSFIIASITSLIGFGIVCFGIWFVYLNKLQPGYFTAGIGVMIEFIAGVIFYLYNKTVVKMGEYHKKLVLTQNIGLALKATDDFECTKKMEVRTKIIEELLKDVNQYLAEK